MNYSDLPTALPPKDAPDRETPDGGTSSEERAPHAPRGEDTRTALLAAGRKLFARRGFEGTSVRDLTREAGTNLGAVTYHFGSKRNLYLEVLTLGISPLVDRVGAAAASDGSPLERLDRVAETFFRHMASDPNIPRLLLQQVVAGKRPPEELVALVRRNLGYVAKIIAEGWEDGSIRPGHPALTALSIVSQPVYMTVMAPLLAEVAGVDLTEETTQAHAIAHVQAFMRQGLAASQENGV